MSKDGIRSRLLPIARLRVQDSPKPPLGLPGFPFKLTKEIGILNIGGMGRGTSIPFTNQKRVQKSLIREEDISQEASISVDSILVEFEAEGRSSQELPKEAGRLLAEGFGGLPRESSFGRVDPDEPN